MKLHNEGLQFRIEELEAENEKLKLKYKNLKEKRSSSEGKDVNLESMKNEIVYLKSKLQNEDKMSLEFEKKLKILTLNHEIELRKLEEKNAEKVRSLNEKIKEFEEKIRDPDLNTRKEEKKLLNRNNSASYIDRKEIKLFKGEVKPQEFIRAKMEREIAADSNLNPASISRTQRRQNDANFLNNNQTKNSISKQINSHRARTTEKPNTYSVSSSVNINNKPSSSNIQSLLGPIANINVTKSTNLQSISNATGNVNSTNNFMKNSIPIDLLSKMNQNGFKTNEINLKQFIYSKATKARSLSKISSVSSKIKSNS